MTVELQRSYTDQQTGDEVVESSRQLLTGEPVGIFTRTAHLRIEAVGSRQVIINTISRFPGTEDKPLFVAETNKGCATLSFEAYGSKSVPISPEKSLEERDRIIITK